MLYISNRSIVLFSLCFIIANAYEQHIPPHLRDSVDTFNRRNFVGLFYSSDTRLEGIRWGNWGSRPYEYSWAGKIVSIQNKKVIDLGVGLPSQYNWYSHAVNNLKPSFYAGIDWDSRIINELITDSHYEIKHMNMADLAYPDKEFDIAYCISTYEHLPYDVFIASIRETFRVLKDDGVLVITLDEEWDKNLPAQHANSWNELEQSLQSKNMLKNNYRSFGLPEFLDLIKDYFVLVQDDAVINHAMGDIVSSKDGYVYYHRNNCDVSILNSASAVNSCVSYAVLKKAPCA